jgi:hypothetical protein
MHFSQYLYESSKKRYIIAFACACEYVILAENDYGKRVAIRLAIVLVVLCASELCGTLLAGEALGVVVAASVRCFPR